jgi:hypothetical protein
LEGGSYLVQAPKFVPTPGKQAPPQYGDRGATVVVTTVVTVAGEAAGEAGA